MSPRSAPATTEASDPFWEATRDGRFLVQWCSACDEPIWFPREVCPRCLSADGLEWRESSGQGVVYAVSVQHRAADPALADRVPYAVALVEVDAGGGDGRTIRVMSNVVDCDAVDVAVGDAVELTWEALEGGRKLAQFRPA